MHHIYQHKELLGFMSINDNSSGYCIQACRYSCRPLHLFPRSSPNLHDNHLDNLVTQEDSSITQ